MASTKTVKPDPKAVAHAEMLWANFLTYSKWGIVAVIVLLALLGVNFIHLSS